MAKSQVNRNKHGRIASKPGKVQVKVKRKSASLKNQMRSCQRLLKQADLDYKSRKAQEDKLLRLKEAEQQRKLSDKERKLAQRYHMAKFFERVKLERAIEKLHRQAKAAPGGRLSAEAASRLALLEDDLLYVKHFPKAEKFVSLMKQADDPTAQEALDAERARLRALVRKQLAENALLAEVNEGQPLVASGTLAGEEGIRTAWPSRPQAAGIASAAASDMVDDFFLSPDREQALQAEDGMDKHDEQRHERPHVKDPLAIRSSPGRLKRRRDCDMPKAAQQEKLWQKLQRAKQKPEKEESKPHRTRAEGGRKRRKKTT